MTLPDKKPVDDDELCGCDADFGAADLSGDDTLPPAFGGVEAQAEDDDRDGCDVFFGSGPTTTDEDLPASTGGVA